MVLVVAAAAAAVVHDDSDFTKTVERPGDPTTLPPSSCPDR